MAELDEVAVPTVRAGELDHAVSDRVNGRAVSRMEVDAAVQRRVAQDRVPTHAVAGSLPAGHRAHQAFMSFTLAGGFVEPAGPAHQLLAWLAVMDEAGVQEL